MKFVMACTYYPPYHLGGDAMHVKYLSEELVKLGHEVHVFYSRDAFKVKNRRFPEEASPSEVITHEFRSNIVLSPYVTYLFGDYFALHRSFNRLVDQIKPDVLHYHNVSLLGYGILNNQGQKTTLYTAHDYWLVCPTNGMVKKDFSACTKPTCFSCSLHQKRVPLLWRYSGGLKRSIRNIDLFIAPSQYTKDKLACVAENKWAVIRNFAPDPPNKIDTPDYSNYYLFVGALENHKGILKLLEIFKKSKNKIAANLLIVGDGSLKNQIIEFIQRYNLIDSVIFLGAVKKDQLYSLYKGANALIVPSIWPENSPLVLLEALSVGTPAIVSNMGGLPEIMNIVDKALIFDNEQELENILIRFSKNRYDRTNILRAFNDNFSSKVYLHQYFSWIKTLEDIKSSNFQLEGGGLMNN